MLQLDGLAENPQKYYDYSNYSENKVYKKDQILLNQIFERILVLLINDAVEVFI